MLKLERDETIGGGLSRIAGDAIDRAAAHLTDEAAALPERVHETRKRFKEIRAILRLARAARAEELAEEKRWLRDAARQLAAERDADALIEAVAALRPAARDPLERRALTRARRVLSRLRKVPEADAGAQMAALTADLAAARNRLAALDGDDRTDLLRAGLRRTYRDGRRAFRAAREERTAAAIHEWRKRVKDLWYQAQIVEPVWPEVLKGHVAVLHDLSHLLGEHHDLDRLAAVIAEHRRSFGRKTAPRLMEIIERRRAEIESVIFQTGAAVYSERPSEWSDRIVRYWRAWRSRAAL